MRLGIVMMSRTREFAISRVGIREMVNNIKDRGSVKSSGENLQRVNKFRNCGCCKSHAKQEVFSFPCASPLQISGKKSYSR